MSFKLYSSPCAMLTWIICPLMLDCLQSVGSDSPRWDGLPDPDLSLSLACPVELLLQVPQALRHELVLQTSLLSYLVLVVILFSIFSIT